MHMNYRLLLFYATAFLSHIVLYTPFHMRPIEPFPGEVEYSICTHMAHVMVKVLQDNGLVSET